MTKINIGPNSYMVLVKAEDCGTGAGGFKPGNDCASGRGGGSDKPKGAPGNDREKQKEQQGKPEFKQWFRDSKVVDKQGNPLVVYHGTDLEFDEFKDVGKSNSRLLGDGFYFASDKQQAQTYGKNVYEVYLRIENPRTDLSDGEQVSLPPKDSKYDGAIVAGLPGATASKPVYFVKDPKQIKSSTDNDGSFDTDKANTTKSYRITVKAGDCGQVDDGTFGPGNDCAAGRGGGGGDKPKATPGKDKDKQREQQEKPEFKEWFGQSKVVDESGNPLVVYHGTYKDFDTFDPAMADRNTASLVEGGMFFTNDLEEARDYAGDGGTVKSVYLNMQNPYMMDSDSAVDVLERQENGKDFLVNNGYDGMIQSFEGTPTEFVVLDPKQIKSSTDNDGSFDPDEANTTKSYRVTLKAGDCGQIDDGTFGPGNDCAAGRGGGGSDKPKGSTDKEKDPVKRQELLEWSEKELGDEEAANNFVEWFEGSEVLDEDGNPIVVYHGTQRPDRVGNVFDPERATSGPMAFFTDDSDIAAGYATDKQDTSLEAPADYAEWFETDIRGRKRDIKQTWYALSREERAEIADKLPHVTNYDKDGNETDSYRLGDKDEYGLAGKGHWDWTIDKESRGNVLDAAKRVWLDSGGLFGRENEFEEVLKLGGVETPVKFKDPGATYPAVYAAYLDIKKPLDTSSIPKRVIEAIEAASFDAPPAQQYGADSWDKDTRDPASWVSRLKTESHLVWTSIPDFVTDALKQEGYDGIKDTGGKMGGQSHTVWIPFASEQVKSSIANRTFDPNDPNINKSYTITVKVGDCGQVDDGTFGPGNDCAAGRGSAGGSSDRRTGEVTEEEKQDFEYFADYERRNTAPSDEPRDDYTRDNDYAMGFDETEWSDFTGDENYNDTAFEIDSDLNAAGLETNNPEALAVVGDFYTSKGDGIVNGYIRNGETRDASAIRKTSALLTEDFEKSVLNIANASDDAPRSELQLMVSGLANREQIQNGAREITDSYHGLRNDLYLDMPEEANARFRDLSLATEDLEMSVFRLKKVADAKMRSRIKVEAKAVIEAAERTRSLSDAVADDLDKATQSWVEKINTVADKPLLPGGKPMTVYRGFSVNSPKSKRLYDEILKGDNKFKMDSFGSASTNLETARDFAYSTTSVFQRGTKPPAAIVFKINTTKGAYLESYSRHVGEYEVLLPKNSEYTVTNKQLVRLTEENGQLALLVEMDREDG